MLAAARRAGAGAPRVLVQEMAAGDEILVGAVVDERFGACVTMRPGGAEAERGAATFVAAPLDRPAGPRLRARRRPTDAGSMLAATTSPRSRRRSRRIARAAHDLRDRLTSLEANPLLVARRGVVAVDALAEARPASIYGLLAALGWGVADFTGTITSRKLGSLWVVLVAQSFSAAVVTVFALATGQDLASASTMLGWVALNAVFSATAYVTHYKALELGPLAVVSPVGATYALVGVVLAVLVLDERPNASIIVGGIVTVVGRHAHHDRSPEAPRRDAHDAARAPLGRSCRPSGSGSAGSRSRSSPATSGGRSACGARGSRSWPRSSRSPRSRGAAS